jgi:NAD-dependent dihydropyrimidine dehydrogenase PreA subunit
MNIDDQYLQAAEAIASASLTPFPITDKLLSILKVVIRPEDLDVVIAFQSKRSQTLAELVQSSGLSEELLKHKLGGLAKGGIIFDQPNRQGAVVYRLLPLLNVGTFEYLFMKKIEPTPQNKELAKLFAELFVEVGMLVQANYDSLIELMPEMPIVDRTVPVLENRHTRRHIVINQSLGSPRQQVLPAQRVAEIIAKFDEIAVGHCFCRHHKDLLGQSCKQTQARENCFTFGKSARYTASQGFARMIAAPEALEILKKAEDDGLVHKTYHPNSDLGKAETSICSCCKCCCVQSPSHLMVPTINAAYYLAKVDPDRCTGCEACLGLCHGDAITIDEQRVAAIEEGRCIGCGLCARACPEEAISLQEGERIVRIAPRRTTA